MKLVQRIGLLFILVAVVLVADRLSGASWPLEGLGLGGGNAPAPGGIVDPSLPAQAYNDSLITRLEEQLKKDPTNAAAYKSLGFGYIQKARDTGDPSYYSRAEGVLEKALQINAQDAVPMVGLGSLALSRHEFQQALDWGFKAYAVAPRNAQVYGVIGDAYNELGNYAGALEAVQNMVNTRPDLSSYSRVSYIRELHGQIPAAIDAMQQAVQAGSPNAENTNWCLVQLGQLYWLQGDLAQAEHQYQQVLTFFPNYMYALAAMGQLRVAQGQLEEAADYYRRASAVVPLPQFVTALVDIYTKQGKTDEAKKQYDLFEFIAQTYKVNRVNFGIEEAIFLADHDRDLTRALDQARQAGATRSDIHTQDSLSWVLYKNGKYDEAWTASQQALRLNTPDPLILFHAGMIAGKRGDVAVARQYLQKALALNPHFHIFYADQATTELQKLGQ